MGTDAPPALELLAEALARDRVPGLVDLFVERVHEVTWRVSGGRCVARQALRREGVALRAGGVLRSTDGADRMGVAALLERPARGLPALALPPFAPPPAADDVLRALPPRAVSLRWRSSWSAVVTPDGATAIHRPPLAEVALADGQRRLTVWPPSPAALRPEDPEPGTAALRSGSLTVLLAPPAAAALLHEVVGHALEGDLLLRRDRGWTPARDGAPFALPIDVDDDPGAPLPGAFSSDDEGRVAARRALIRSGAPVSALADVAAAAALGIPPGNGRRGGVHAPPRPRMSNLLLRAPLSPLEALRAEAAVEVASSAGASVDPETGAVVLAVRRATSLHGGRPRHALAPFTLHGTVAGVRSGLVAAGGEAEAAAEPGWCRKEGEVVPTGASTPWLLVAGLEAR